MPQDFLEGFEKMEFETHVINSRKDLLHFVEEELDNDILKKLSENPNKWVEELNIINLMLTGDSLCAVRGILPNIEDPNFNQIGKDVFLSRNANRGNGLWISEERESKIIEQNKKRIQWTHYGIGETGYLRINKEFNHIPLESFLPENFESKSKLIRKNRRPIFNFNIETKNGDTVEVYAKGCLTEISKMYYPPSYRLTNLSDIIRTNSKKELERFVNLSNQGIMVPTILGYYETKIEEFLFVKGLKGCEPSKFLESDFDRKEIIKQDAKILATLCLMGYNKQGFTDFDDKIFDGKDLYLIDVDEISDFYFPHFNSFRGVLLNPLNKTKLNEFRRMQMSLFEQHLKDAIFNYKDSLTRTLDDKMLYISSFFEKIGRKKPTEDYVRKLTTYPKDYISLNSHISMMMEE